MRPVMKAQKLVPFRSATWRVKNNRTQVLSIASGVCGYIETSIGTPKIIDEVVAQGRPHCFSIFSDIAATVAARGICQLRCAVDFRRSKRDRAVLQPLAID